MKRVFLYPDPDGDGRNHIKQFGTLRDIDALGIQLAENLRLPFFCDDANNQGVPDDLYFEGTVHFDEERQSWYVLIDESSFRPASTDGKEWTQR